MKKKAYRFLCAAAFLACFLVLFSGISGLMRSKTGGKIDMVHSFYKLKRNSLDVLALGSSHVYYGFQPNVLWNEHGVTSYVMGSPEQSVASSYFLLKEAFQYQKPKVVLLESYYFWFDGLYSSEARIRQAFDGVRIGKAKHEMIETFLPDRPWKEKAGYYLPFLMYHDRWDELNENDFHSWTYLKGSKPSNKRKKCKGRSVDVPEVPVPEVNLEYLDKIIELCEENDAKLVVFATPYVLNKKKIHDRRQGVNLALEAYLLEKEIPFLFYQKTGEAKIDHAHDFADLTHLNAKGQAKVTHEVGKYLTARFDMPDHRGDPAYETWNRDYKLYLSGLE